MTVTEESRHRLHQALDSAIGPEEATTLMEHLPPVGWADVATKQDLADLKDAIGHRFEMVEARFDGEHAYSEHRFKTIEARFDREHAYSEHLFEMARRDTNHIIEMVGAQFGRERIHVDGRFDLVDERFAKVDVRFDAIEHRLAGIEARLNQQFWQFLSLVGLVGGIIFGILRYT